ncbi:MAG: NAD(P)-dependent glycerol-3-phosphate dehydrogenase [Planctomycetes bacterium]|nr:NAD(P)-dependent glycerol-3-phosphate dehydrogenase [Planctomycetota bacterium]
MSKRIAVIGAGGWGTAVAGVLADKGHEVELVAHDPEHLREMIERRENVTFLPGYRIPEPIRLGLDGSAALRGADIVVSAVPTKYLRTTWSVLAAATPKRAPVVSLTKGIETKTFLRASEIIHEYLPRNPVAVLSGPSHAEEVAQGMPTTVTIASRGRELGESLQRAFSTARFRVYTNKDLFGVEFSGAMKNVIALAAGIVDGLGFGDNTKSALLTRGLAEIVALGTALGAKRKTFYGMAGVGDLITTAFSPHGRNRAVGERIGRGETLEAILATSKKVAEGVGTTRAVHDLARTMKIEMPITTEVFRVLFKDKDPRLALTQLMTRKGKDE